ncbi:MAG: oxidoreductase [Bellilinea sp.]|nr:MAG: oxidoreductase [Bellilinea sp.]
MQLKDKVAIITGAGSGIGAAIARQFSQEGATVVLWDIDLNAAEEIRQTCSFPLTAVPMQVDVTRPDQVEEATLRVVHQFQHLDVLVNVAGGSGRRWGDGPVDSCSLEGWHKTLDLNLNSVFYCCKFAIQAMLPQRKGAVVVISSVLGLVGGDEDFATHAYAASKGAAISLTRSIAAYYAPHGIRANVICPGLIATPMSQRAQQNQNIRSRLADLQPLTADFGQPEDVAGAAVFLASDAARFVTGAVLTVDGGWTAR